MQELDSIKEQIVSNYQPDKIILFGSLARGVVHKNSDIDLCVIKDTIDKRKLQRDISMHVDSNKPFDIIVYTPKEWDDLSLDKSRIAYIVSKEGKTIYDRFKEA